MQFIYTWELVYKEIVSQLPAYRHKQPELLKMLQAAGIAGFTDRDKEGNEIPLDEVDPFTFLCYLNKFSDVRRKKVLRHVAAAFGISLPVKDVCGIPTTNAQKLWLFPYKRDREHNEIDRLWNLFEHLLKDNITDAEFRDILTINGVGLQKITEVFYMVKPQECLCLNSVVKPYLQEKYNINPFFTTFSELKQLYTRIKREVKLPFPQISYDAYLHKAYGGRQPKYYRIGTTDPPTSYLPQMLENSVASIGWWDIGDIENIDPLSRSGIQAQLQEVGFFTGDNRTASRKAGEIWTFYESLVPGDVIALADGDSVKALGRVATNNYSYEESFGFPHCRLITLLQTSIEDLAIPEGRMTTVWQYEYPESIAALETYLNKIQRRAPEPRKRSARPDIGNTYPNTIYFGPPGTGKTYKIQQLIEKWGLVEKASPSSPDYQEFADGYSWWELVFMALLDLPTATVPELQKHRLIQAKFNLNPIKHFGQRLWSTLQTHAVEDCQNVKTRRGSNLVFYKEEDSRWRLDNRESSIHDYEELVDAWKTLESPIQMDKETKRYIFTTCHQNLSYQDFIEGIKPYMNEKDGVDEDNDAPLIQYEIKKGLFYKACNRACQLAGYANLEECLQDTKEGRQDKFDIAIRENNIMVLFLDEINRCNVAEVFGELITLIENDRRLGAKYEIADCLLPYSQKPFGVPQNLYIIGAMNTADRSVEALDTALRRRFNFESFSPDTDLLKDIFIGDIHLSEVLSAINTRIKVLLDADHLIGHSYFLELNTEEDLKQRFKTTIIPLLQEYFFNDYGKIGLILGKAFVEVHENPVKFAKGFPHPDLDDFESVTTYSLVSPEKWTSESFQKIYAS